jgi:RsmE family RNA methyltransferase
VNLLLFDVAETTGPLPRRDPRAVHLLDVLRRSEGGTFDAGLVNGPRGTGTLVAIGADALTLAFAWGPPPPPPDEITLVIGLPRPQTARDLLRELTALGVAALHFVGTEKSDPNYAHSTLWSSGEWRRHLRTGAAQAFCTRVPAVTPGHGLADTLAALPAGGARLALDNYESPAPLSRAAVTRPVVLALGPERGWTAGDRTVLRAHGFRFVHLGARVLRTETAAIVGVALIKTKLGSL